ncbi:MAG: hypothetical protein AAFP16_00345 [Pseudomonadota bacterium]
MTGPALAQDFIWDPDDTNATADGGDGNWNLTNNNWDNDGNPGVVNRTWANGRDAVFNDANPVGDYAVTVTENGIIASNLEFNANNVTLNTNNGSSMQVNGTVFVNSATATINVDQNGDLTVAGTGDLNVGGDVAGTVNTTDTGTTTLTGTVGALDSDSGTTILDGAAEVTGTTTIDNSEVNIVSNNATMTGDTTVNAGGVLDVDAGTVGNVDNEGGTVEISGGTVNSLDNNSGNTVIDGGTIDTTTTIAAGEITIDGGTLTGQTTVNGGTLDINAGADIGAIENDGGTVEIDGSSIDSFVNTSGNTTMNDGRITGTVSVDGDTFLVDGGRIDGVTTVNTGGTFDLDSGQIGDVDNEGGTIDISGGSIASLDNNSGNTAMTAGTVSGDASVSGGEITTSGTARLNGDTTVSGTGVLDVDGGTIGNVINNGGTVEVGLGTVADIENNAGTTTIDGGTVTTVDNNGGTVTLTAPGAIGTLNNNNAFTFNGGTITDVNNTDTFDVVGAQTIGGNFVNDTATGVLNVQAGESLSSTSPTGTLTNQNGATVTVDNTGSITFNSVINTGTGSVMTVNGTVTSTTVLNNADSAQLIVGATGDVEADIQNTADLDLNGGSVNGIDNNAGGDVDVAGGTVDTTVTNAGTFDVNSGTLTVTGTTFTNENNGTLTVADTAALTADVTNQNGGTADLQGTLTGSLQNDAGGNTDFSTATNVTGSVTNDGDIDVLDGAVVTVTGAFTNNADLDIAGEIASDITSAGDITLSDPAGLITGALTQSAGTLTTDAGEALTVTGGATINGGTVTNDGSLLGGDYTFNAGTTYAQTGTFGTGAQTLTNNNAASFSLAGTVDGNFTQTDGTTQLADGLNITGNLVMNAGDLSLSTGADLNLPANAGELGTTVTVGGNATLNGIINFDVDLQDGAAATGDRIDVGGSLSGDFDLNFNTTNAQGNIDNITLFTYGSLVGVNVDLIDLTGLPLVGAFEYFLADSGTATTLQSRVSNGIGGLGASVGLTQTVVGSIINRPTSPYVTDLATDFGERPCGAGAWARVTAGEADVDGSFTDITNNSSSNTPLDLSYQGIQAGGDFACFDDRYGGFDLAFGAIVGYNSGDTTSVNTLGAVTDSVTNTDFSQAFGGVYVTASRDRLFGDLQLRFENTTYEATNIDQFATNGSISINNEFDTSGTTLSGSVGYSWAIPSVEGLNFVGSAGFSYTDLETDAISITGFDAAAVADTENILQLEDSSIELGFVSGTLSRTRLLPDGNSLVNYFVTGTYYSDFADDPKATLTTTDLGTNAVTTTNLELSNLGDYGEISVGLNYIKLLNTNGDGAARQLSAAARLDYRTGDVVDSYGITGQVRIQW